MTIQSLAWAIEQQVPGDAGRVLIALANHTDHTSGEVHFSAAIVSRESAIQEASLPRYLGALRRNGFLVRVDAKDGRHYWLQFDRDESKSWAWDAEVDDVSDTSERRTAFVGGVKPSTFQPTRQTDDRETIAAAEAARVAQGVPVIEGSDAFKAWCKHFSAQHKIAPYVRNIEVQGKVRRGFMMPTLFPRAEPVEKSEGSAA